MQISSNTLTLRRTFSPPTAPSSLMKYSVQWTSPPTGSLCIVSPRVNSSDTPYISSVSDMLYWQGCWQLISSVSAEIKGQHRYISKPADSGNDAKLQPRPTLKSILMLSYLLHLLCEQINCWDTCYYSVRKLLSLCLIPGTLHLSVFYMNILSSF
jgi:hypothetical protein